MVILGGWVFHMSEAPLYGTQDLLSTVISPDGRTALLQWYLAHRKHHTRMTLQ